MGLFTIIAICFLIGVGLAVILIGIPALLLFTFQILKILYALLILLPIQIIRVIQGKPPVEKKQPMNP